MQLEREYKLLTRSDMPKGIDIFEIIHKGLPANAVDNMASAMGVAKKTVAPLFGASPRALQNRANDAKEARLSEQSSDRAFQLAKLFNSIEEYFGSREAANKWLQTPNKALGDVTPFERCKTVTGMDYVEEVINRLRYGMTA